jgi:hypothetical protein
MGQTVRFTRDTCGGHFISVTTPKCLYRVKAQERVSFNINDLDVEGLRELINGLSNMLGSVAARMYQLEIKPEYRR